MSLRLQGAYVWTLHDILPTAWFHQDVSLAFCYANSVVQEPTAYFEADYYTVELLKIPAGSTLAQCMLEQCTSYELPKAPEERLQSQTCDEELALWQSLPQVIHDRRAWWK